MGTRFTAPSIRANLFSHLKLSVYMSWIIAVAGKEAHPVALARRPGHHHPAFIFTAQRQRPAARASSPFCDRQRLRWAPPTHQSFSTRTPDVSVCCCSLAMPASFSPAATAWRSSKDGLHPVKLRRDGRVSAPSSSTPLPCAVHFNARCFGDDVRGPSSGGRSSSYKQESTKHFALGEDVTNRDGSLSNKKAAEEVDRRDDFADDEHDDNDISPVTVPKLEPLVERVASALEHHCCVHGGDLVLVLVSGGSDSVALLLALEHAAKIFLPALRVEAAHFNHALRGEDSDADEEFVKDMASRLGVPLHVRRWRGAEEGGTGGPGAGMQERARRWRRLEAQDILTRIMSEAGAGEEARMRGYIATAHHRDDQAETVLLKALRGAHITKMQGMAWHAAPFVRPLLEARKSDLVDFLHERGQGWREDGSNQVAKYARNRVRLQLVPLLQELAGGARALDTRLDELSRQSLFAREMLEREALRWERQHLDGRDGSAGSTSGAGIAGQCEALGPSAETGLPEERGKGAKASPHGVRRDEFPLSAFVKKAGTGSGGEDREQRWRDSDLPELVREELLHRFVMANTGNAPMPYAQLQLLLRQVDGGERKWSLSLGGGVYLRRVGDLLRIEHSRTKVRVNPPELEGPDPILGTAVAQREAGEPSIAPQAQHAADAATTPWRIDVSPCHQDSTGLGREGAESEGKETEQFMVLYNVAARTELHVRRKRDGDRFRPAWRDRPAKLKDFLRGQGVPLHRRDEVALICAEDKVIAVYPSYPAFEFSQDTTGARPVCVRIKGAPLFCPRPEDRGGAPA